MCKVASCYDATGGRGVCATFQGIGGGGGKPNSHAAAHGIPSTPSPRDRQGTHQTLVAVYARNEYMSGAKRARLEGNVTQSLDPIVQASPADPEVHTLILGTHPSIKSFASAAELSESDIALRGGAGPQAYGNPRNTFVPPHPPPPPPPALGAHIPLSGISSGRRSRLSATHCRTSSRSSG